MNNFKLTSLKTFVFASFAFLIITVCLLSKIGLNTTMFGIDIFINDDSCYLRSAEILIKTGQFTHRYPGNSAAAPMPGMALLLAPFVAIFGRTTGAVGAYKIFQILLQLAHIYLVGLLAEKAGGKRISKIAMLILATYLPWTIYTNFVYTEMITTFLLLLMMFISVLAFERKPEDATKLYIAVGLLWSISVLIRPNMVLFPPIMMLMFIIKKYKLKEIGKIVGIVSIIFVLVMSPWWIRNAITFGRFIPLSSASGDPMYFGTFYHEAMHGDEASKNYQLWAEERDEIIRIAENDEFLLDIEMKTRAKKKIRNQFKQDFGSALKWYTLEKTYAHWSTPWIPNIDYYSKIAQEVMFSYAQHVTMTLLAFAGVVFTLLLKKKNKASEVWFFLLLMPLCFNLANLPYFGSPRYMIPVIPIVIIFSAAAIDRLIPI